jgi:PX domain/PB1 domain
LASVSGVGVLNQEGRFLKSYIKSPYIADIIFDVVNCPRHKRFYIDTIDSARVCVCECVILSRLRVCIPCSVSVACRSYLFVYTLLCLYFILPKPVKHSTKMEPESIPPPPPPLPLTDDDLFFSPPESEPAIAAVSTTPSTDATDTAAAAAAATTTVPTAEPVFVKVAYNDGVTDIVRKKRLAHAEDFQGLCRAVDKMLEVARMSASAVVAGSGGAASSIDEKHALAASVAPKLYRLVYIDEDGDRVTITNAEDLSTATEEASTTIKIHVVRLTAQGRLDSRNSVLFDDLKLRAEQATAIAEAVTAKAKASGIEPAVLMNSRILDSDSDSDSDSDDVPLPTPPPGFTPANYAATAGAPPTQTNTTASSSTTGSAAAPVDAEAAASIAHSAVSVHANSTGRVSLRERRRATMVHVNRRNVAKRQSLLYASDQSTGDARRKWIEQQLMGAALVSEEAFGTNPEQDRKVCLPSMDQLSITARVIKYRLAFSKDNSSKPHVEYELEVYVKGKGLEELPGFQKSDRLRYVLHRRYAQFHKLHKQVEHLLDDVEFPPKRMLFNFDEHFLATRLADLQTWISRVVFYNDVLGSRPVLQFLNFHAEFKKFSDSLVERKSPDEPIGASRDPLGLYIDLQSWRQVSRLESSSQYVEYKLCIHSVNRELRWIIERRYSEFLQFKDRLDQLIDGSSNLVGVVLPPFPPKQQGILSRKNQNALFVRARYDMLQTWLEAVCDEPRLRNTQAYMSFADPTGGHNLKQWQRCVKAGRLVN